MSLLPMLLLTLAAVAAVGVFAYAQALPGDAGEELLDAATTDYQALHAQWHALEQVRDWDSLKSQVRRWQESVRPGCEEAQVEQVARHLNLAVFRFAMPGERRGLSSP